MITLRICAIFVQFSGLCLAQTRPLSNFMAAKSGPRRALILGHSYIRRLGDFCHISGRDNLCLDHDQILVSFRGIGGARVAALWDLLNLIHQFEPDVLTLQIGGHDLDWLTSDQVAHSIIQFLHYLADHFHLPCVYVCQLLPHISPRILPHFYNNVAVPRTNQILATYLNVNQRIPGTSFWYHSKGLATLRPDFYLPAGVHLSPRSMLSYYKRVRGTVLSIL